MFRNLLFMGGLCGLLIIAFRQFGEEPSSPRHSLAHLGARAPSLYRNRCGNNERRHEGTQRDARRSQKGLKLERMSPGAPPFSQERSLVPIVARLGVQRCK